MPCSIARRAAASAASCAANGVDLREPLKPTWPEEAQEMTAPVGSVIDTMVLLKVLLMCACPCATFLRSLRRTFLTAAPVRAFGGISFVVLLNRSAGGDAVPVRQRPSPRGAQTAPLGGQIRPGVAGGPSAPDCYFLPGFFLLATTFFGPLRVRALVRVRWPRTGRPRR